MTTLSDGGGEQKYWLCGKMARDVAAEKGVVKGGSLFS